MREKLSSRFGNLDDVIRLSIQIEREVDNPIVKPLTDRAFCEKLQRSRFADPARTSEHGHLRFFEIEIRKGLRSPPDTGAAERL